MRWEPSGSGLWIYKHQKEVKFLVVKVEGQDCVGEAYARYDIYSQKPSVLVGHLGELYEAKKFVERLYVEAAIRTTT